MHAVVAGATGMVGGLLVEELLAQGAQVSALVRRPALAHRERLDERVVDFAALTAEQIPEDAEAAFCCLGTTMRKAGSEAAFRAVDHDAVLAFARGCRERGVPQLHVVTALGADASSRVFYKRVKGETEDALRGLGVPTLCIYRPSLLMGERQERRPGERAGIVAARVLNPVLVGPLRRYRGIDARVVARAMAREAHAQAPGAAAAGVRVLRSEQIAQRGAAQL